MERFFKREPPPPPHPFWLVAFSSTREGLKLLSPGSFWGGASQAAQDPAIVGAPVAPRPHPFKLVWISLGAKKNTQPPKKDFGFQHSIASSHVQNPECCPKKLGDGFLLVFR